MQLTICDTQIKQDSEGRYCLNDLHRAAGGERKHGPSLWLANGQTEELIAEIGDAGNPVSVIKGGKSQGTYVCKELVYHYAMWISPSFNLKVIRTFDQMASAANPQLPALPKTFAEALRLAADQSEQIALMAPKVEAFDTFLSCKNAMPFNEAAKVLGTGRGKLFDFCRESGLLMSGGANHNLPYQSFKDRGYFEVREVTIQHSDWQERKSQTLITTEGIEYIRKKMKGESS